MQSTIDFSEMTIFPSVDNSEQLVATYFIDHNRAPSDLKVEVFKSLKKGLFMGKCNYAFWGPSQFGPYRNVNLYPTIDLAFHSATSGYRLNDSPNHPNDLIFWESEIGTYFDGNGIQVTYNEIQERRKNSKHE